MEATKFQRATCELTIEKINYDMQVYVNHCIKCKDRVSAQYHQVNEWRKERVNAATKVASNFLQEHVMITTGGNTEEWHSQYTNFKEKIGKAIGSATGDIVSVCVLNWVAPCTVSSFDQKTQASMIGAVMSESQTHNMGLILMPMFSHKQNMLWLTETSALQQLGEHRLAFDVPFQLRFGAHNDKRDERPLNYHGRAVSPYTAKAHKSMWETVPVIKDNTTPPAMHVSAADMVVCEDMSEDALPATIDNSPGGYGHMSRGKKFAQIGTPVYESLLQGTILALPSDAVRSTAAVIFHDLNVHVGTASLHTSSSSLSSRSQ